MSDGPCIDPTAWEDLAHIFDPSAETCAFMVGRIEEAGPVVLEFWPTENMWEERLGKRQKDQGYAIPATEWNKARAQARKAGLVVLGHCHTHPGSTAMPSFFDYRGVKRDEFGAIWHLHSGRFTLFNRERALLQSYAIAYPPVFTAFAALFASPAVDLAELPAPEPVQAPPVPDDVVEAARHIVRTLRDPAALRRALKEAGVADLSETEITPARLAALEAAAAR